MFPSYILIDSWFKISFFKLLFIKILVFSILNNVWLLFREADFIIVSLSLWKSERQVSEINIFWKLLTLLVRDRYMHNEFNEFL